MQEERGLSIPEQFRQIREYAERHGMEIVEEFQETASAFKKESHGVELHRRPERAKSDRSISAILVHDLTIPAFRGTASKPGCSSGLLDKRALARRKVLSASPDSIPGAARIHNAGDQTARGQAGAELDQLTIWMPDLCQGGSWLHQDLSLTGNHIVRPDVHTNRPRAGMLSKRPVRAATLGWWCLAAAAPESCAGLSRPGLCERRPQRGRGWPRVTARASVPLHVHPTASVAQLRTPRR